MISFMKQKMNILVTVYTIAFAIYSLVSRIMPVCQVLQPVNGIIYILFGGVGTLLAIFSLVFEKIFYQVRFKPFIIVFIGITIISSICNLSYGYMDNVKTILWLIIHFVLFYSLYIRVGKEQFEKNLIKVCYLSIAIWFVAIIVSFVQYLFQYAYVIKIDGHLRRQGFVDNRLFGIFNDPNYAAVVSLMAMCICLWLITKNRSKALRGVLVFNMIANYCYIILSGSRSATVCMIVAVIILSVCLIKNCAINKAWKNGVKVFAVIFGTVIIVTATIGVSFGSQYVLSYMHFAGTDQKDKDLLKRKDANEENISNNRFKIWTSYIKATEGKRILGLSPRNSLPYIQDHYPKSYISKTKYETHNGYLSVLVGTGIINSLVIILWGCMIFILFLKTYMRKKITNNYIFYTSILAIILANAFFFTDLFFTANITSAIFCTLLGYGICENEKQINMEQEGIEE